MDALTLTAATLATLAVIGLIAHRIGKFLHDVDIDARETHRNAGLPH